ncbi:CHAT domain-containing protein [Roseofilum reptotaenium CS-1145]|nr:CHAT domain-containing tetratricopeptide repeat protein [Roseofilum reptotaenium]MDB9516556.1 CHAT domain-containing protein [Roseofilum reptotaenium CS-1145]
MTSIKQWHNELVTSLMLKALNEKIVPLHYQEQHTEIFQPLEWKNLSEQHLLLFDRGKYEEAISKAERVLKLAREIWGNEHKNVATSANGLANLYQVQGKYSEAELLYEEAIRIGRMTNHPELAKLLGNFAELCRVQGEYSKGELLCKEGVEVGRSLPDNHTDLALCLNILALLYQFQGKYSEVESLFKEAIEIDRTLPNNDLNLARDFNRMAGLYLLQGRYSEAELLLQKATDIFRRALPQNHPNLATHLHNVAVSYQYQGRYSEAEPLFQEAIEIDSIALPDGHPDLAQHHCNFAWLYKDQGRYTEALQQFQASLECEQKRLRYIFSTHSDRERREYLQSNRQTYDVFLSLVSQYLADDPEAVGAALDAVLRRKSLTTEALAAQSAAIYSGRYGKAVIALFRKRQAYLEKLGEAMYTPPAPQIDREVDRQQREQYCQFVKDLQTKAETLEKQLAKKVPELQLNQQTINWQEIAKELPKGWALVEFVRFRHRDFEGKKWQEERYLAFTVMAHQPEQVRLIDLGEAQALDRLITQFRHYFIGPGDKLGRYRPGFAQQQAKKQEKLYQVLCRPLIEVLGGASHWFLAPDSALNLLPFQILPMPSSANSLPSASSGQRLRERWVSGDGFAPSRSAPHNGYLGDMYSMSYLSSGRDLLRQSPKRKPNTCPATILADPDYDWDGVPFDSAQGTLSAQGTPSVEGKLGVETLATLSGFERAAGTDIFGRQVAELLKMQPYLDKEAVSTHLTDSACPRILAIATHGFARMGQKPYREFVLALLATDVEQHTKLFEQNPHLMNPHLLEFIEQAAQYNDAENPEISQCLLNLTPQIQAYLNAHPPSRLDAEDADDAMYRAGVALAGANVWNQGKPLPEGMKGILFAQDIASLDLWGNELSALIACQTGLGEVSSGEGVFGLRRAFVVAGSKTLIMSLWSVPALATAYLMEWFFHYLDQGEGRAAALATAQSDVRRVTAGELHQSELGQAILQELGKDYADKECPLSHPYYWGAWVCQGDIGGLAINA